MTKGQGVGRGRSPTINATEESSVEVGMELGQIRWQTRFPKPVVASGQTAGHEIEHPMAVVILGGLVSSTILTLLVTPSLYAWLGRSGRAAGQVPVR